MVNNFKFLDTILLQILFSSKVLYLIHNVISCIFDPLSFYKQEKVHDQWLKLLIVSMRLKNLRASHLNRRLYRLKDMLKSKVHVEISI